MPTYNFRNIETGEITSEFMTISAMEERLSSGLYDTAPAMPPLVRGNPKPDAGFREVLKRVKRGNPGSTVHTWD